MLYFCEECGASRGCEEWCRAAIVGSHAERQDPGEGLGPKDGRAVPKAIARTSDRMTRTCIDCGKGEVGPTSKTGICKRCQLVRARSDPAFEAKRLARLAAANSSPEGRARISAALKGYYAKHPERREALRDYGREHWTASIGSEKSRAAANTPEVNARRISAFKKRYEKQLAWCPPQYRDEYRALLRKRGMNASKAKAAMIADRIPPFERQMWAIQQGAGISTRTPMPSKSYDYTLAGGSPL